MLDLDLDRDDLRLLTPLCGLAALVPGARRDRLAPHEHVLDVHLGGAMSGYRYRDERRAPIDAPCPPDSWRFLEAGVERRLGTTRSGRTLRLHFDASALRRFGADAEPLRADGEHHRFDDALLGAATIVDDHLAGGAARVDAAFVHHGCELLLGRLVHCLRRPDAAPARGRPDAVQRAIELIETRLDSALTLQRVADTVGVSQYHFARLFRLGTGTSLQRYVLGRRMARARELILRSDAPLADIAYRVGFGSQSHMTTLFRKHAGRTPGEIRRARPAGAGRRQQESASVGTD